MSTSYDSQVLTQRKQLPNEVKDAKGQTLTTMLRIPKETMHKILADDLKCPICLGPLSSCVTVSTCLHRFCSECFERSLRELTTNHECPACRAKVGSRRQSKKDQVIDHMVKLFAESVGSVDYLPVKSHEVITPTSRGWKRARLDPSINQTSNMISSIDLSMYQQKHREKIAEFREKQKTMNVLNKRTNTTTSSSSSNKNNAKNTNINHVETGPRICLALFPYPEWVPSSDIQSKYPNIKLSLPYLKVPAFMQIGDIKQYLQSKFQFDRSIFNHLEILLQTSTKNIVLDESLTMSDILMEIWEENTLFVLYYRIFDEGYVVNHMNVVRQSSSASHHMATTSSLQPTIATK